MYGNYFVGVSSVLDALQEEPVALAAIAGAAGAAAAATTSGDVAVPATAASAPALGCKRMQQ